MFTGIIEAQGTIRSIRSDPSGGRTLEIEHPFGASAVGVGDSVAHDGVCLTATQILSERTYAIDAGPETLERTTVGAWTAGQSVNLERAATLNTRLGGHLVQGHVDAVGRVRSVVQRANAWDLWVEVPAEVLRLVIPRGSVAVDGISLTVTGRDPRGFSLSIIPHTWAVTGLRSHRAGASVNVEVDLIARYVLELVEPLAEGGRGAGLSWARLSELGYGAGPTDG